MRKSYEVVYGSGDAGLLRLKSLAKTVEVVLLGYRVPATCFIAFAVAAKGYASSQ